MYSSYYIVVVFIVPLQGLYVILPKILWIVYQLLVLKFRQVSSIVFISNSASVINTASTRHKIS